MTMLRALFKIIITIMLLNGLSIGPLRAEVRLYQYDGKLPFVQMMLNMMVAMGILDRVPARGYYGAGYGSSPYTNPYLRALMLRGYNPGMAGVGGWDSMYGNNPFLSSPWLGSPWTIGSWSGTDLFGGDTWTGNNWNGYNNNLYSSPLWGTPSWGVLPTDDYAMLDMPYDSPWRDYEIDRWAQEPWDDVDAYPRRSASARDNAGRAASEQPIVLNNIITTQPALSDAGAVVPGMQTPLSKLAPPDERESEPKHRSKKSEHSERLQASPLYKYSQRAGKYVPAPQAEQRKFLHPNEPLCVTPFCGLKKPDLNGLWVSQTGEMLGIKNDRYLWSDGDTRYLTGHMKIQNEYLLANVEGHDSLLRFKYKLADDHLLTLRPDGTISQFVRVPVNSYSYP
jgi:hypothetical protein